MSITWHIFRKDLRRLRIPVGAWVLIMAAKLAFYAAISGVVGQPHLEWLARMMDAPALVTRSMLEPFVAFVLVASLVFEDPLTGSDPFWVTRPISGLQLLGAKVFGAGLLFVAIPVAINLPWWIACGFGPSGIVRAAIPMGIEYLLVALVGMAVASATNNFPRYFLWTVTGIAAIATAHLLVPLLLGNGINLDAVSASEVGEFATRLTIIGASTLLLALELICFRFMARNSVERLSVAAALTLASSAAACSLGLNFFPETLDGGPKASQQTVGSAVMGLVGPRGGQPLGAGDIHVNITDDGMNAPSYKGYMFVPISISGLPDDVTGNWKSTATWTRDGATLWKAWGLGEGEGGNADMFDDGMRRMLGVRQAAYHHLRWNVFTFPRALASRIEREPAALHLTVDMYLFKGRIVGEYPQGVTAARYAGGSFSVQDYVRDISGIRMLVTDRSEVASVAERFGLVWPRTTSWALFSRAHGRLLGVRRDTLGPWGLQLNMVQVTTHQISYWAKLHPEWLDDSDFVVCSFVGDQRIEIGTDEDPFRFKYYAAGPEAKTTTSHR